MPSGVREPTIPLICNVCGKHFLGRTKTDKYCSKECQKNSMRQLKNERERLKSIEKYKNDPDALTCKECGYMAHDLCNHIKRLHMPIEDYCKKHNLSTEDFLELDKKYEILNYVAECPDIFDSLTNMEMVEEIEQYVSES